ncbi:hypothetical protein [Paenibacillus segetis]|uniref:Uncharacterized protein n=1 Tax=Paenibacillus segetis TaxID=1325360 RepID=A0ABQ1YJX3_9BACL|nr:hypothetical protein [Paenibacillus segetis]GGH28569.1 hypothetical protein GCM10008013_30680 [Paenibacillus segetis]
MSDKEIYELDVVIDNRDIDKTEKKLKGLDKLLQQTQRRASVLGKTKIAPKVNLDDRVTSKVTRIRYNLMKLDRMKVTPVATLIDHVSSNIGGIRASLASLTQTRRSVAVDGVAWDIVIGKSFDDWIGSDGQSTLAKISSAIGTALGNGLRGFIMQALGLAEVPKATREFDYLEKGSNPLEEESPYAEAGRRAGETFFQSFLGVLDSEQVASKLGNIPLNNGDQDKKSGLGGYLKEIGSKLAVSLPVTILSKSLSAPLMNMGKKLLKLVGIGKKAGVATEVATGVETTTGTLSRTATLGTRGNIFSKALTKVFSYGSKALNYGSKTFAKVIPYGSKALNYGSNALTKALPYGSKALSFLKGPTNLAGLVFSIYETQKFMDRTGMSDMVRDTPERIWEGMNTPITEINGKPVEGMGYFEHWAEIGKEGYNSVTSKDTWGKYWDLIKSSWDKMRNGEKIYNSSEDNNSQQFFTEDQLSSFGETLNDSNKQPMVSVSTTPGTVNLTVQKDEIDYEQLANLAGWQIADAVKYSMQNLKE